MTTLHENCTAEYTLNATLAGTYSVAVVPKLQGALLEEPKACTPKAVRLVGRLMLDNIVQSKKA